MRAESVARVLLVMRGEAGMTATAVNPAEATTVVVMVETSSRGTSFHRHLVALSLLDRHLLLSGAVSAMMGADSLAETVAGGLADGLRTSAEVGAGAEATRGGMPAAEAYPATRAWIRGA
jgi:hypothetical protein